MTPDPEEIRRKVREGYAGIATGASAAAGGPTPLTSGCGCTPRPRGATPSTSCCGGADPAADTARRFGYSEADLAALPAGANLGLSCGNPTALAALRPGEVVIDLGSGGGFDAFLAGPRVGAAGRVIGVDMTAEMISKARGNLAAYRRHSGLDNVEFRLGEIEHLPVADAGADVIISNCVINLSPDKPQVWREMARVLRPGGRVAISDLALLQPLPEAVTGMVEALVGCVAGAVPVAEIEAMARAAGFTDLTLTPKPDYVRGMASWQDPLYVKIAAALPPGAGPADYITSLDIAARKR